MRWSDKPCPPHERDPFNAYRCWKCGAKMRAPASRGKARVKKK